MGETSVERYRWLLAPLAASYLALAWLGNASMVAVDYFEYSWTEPVPYGSLLSDMASVPTAELFDAFDSFYLMPFLNPLMLLTAILAGVAIWSDRPRLLTGAAAVTIPYGLLGILTALPLTFDTEWFSEGWSTLLAFSAWSLILCVLALRWNAPRLFSEAAPELELATQSVG